ncbi:ABC transporter substrate-binding protein [Burkholderia sp. Ac-20345]|uniref:ABC transporter substrate-binding protein n=1 Tax=Burkholderia sp. Ac-20345 TaxID=2703891 RepID=UPI00197BA8B6|nr:ABC transporter substrate-binding protein [Burkholderia sp. Ac-20345]MBN3778997.1 ABC transporter substrate-binding protein [Burkholderia sp. Ac-20345]
MSIASRLGAAAIAATLLGVVAGPVCAADSVTFAGYGGDYQKNIVKALIKPAADKEGLDLRTESHDGLATVRVQVTSGRPAWDIVQLGAEECATGSAQGLFEKLDYKLIDTSGIPAAAHAADWIASNYYSVVLAYRTDKYKNNPPKTWADFWDVKKFPGKRALALQPQETMEVALLGDGVSPDKLYPLDQKRALQALGRLKPSIAAWWTTGAQSAQLLRDGEVDMEAIWGSRIAPVIQSGAPVNFTFNQGLLAYACLAIPKGAKHAAEARKVIADAVAPSIQANIPEVLPSYGPVNSKVFEGRKFSPEVLAKANSSPQNRAMQVQMNGAYWGQDQNLQKGNEALRALISQ